LGIKRLKVSNFKSFKNIDVELKDLNIIIGANASGKSNFIEIFRFLRDITLHGLKNAVSMQGGGEYLKNIRLSDEISIEINYPLKTGRIFREKKQIQEFSNIEYSFILKVGKGTMEYFVKKDSCKLHYNLYKLRAEIGLRKGEQIGNDIVEMKKHGSRLSLKWNKNLGIKEEDIIPPFIEKEKLPAPKLLIELIPYLFIPVLIEIFPNIAIYDFDTKLTKKAYPITGKNDLEENAENLAIVLKNIFDDRKKKTKFMNLMKDILPFVKSLKIEKSQDKSLLLKLKETYSREKFLPAFLMSDGTMSIAAIIVALYFENRPFIIFEEPERNIHPSLIAQLMEMLKDASQNKQIIVTTHNPELIKYADLENIFLVSRDKESFSTITKPKDNKRVQNFLKHEIGIDELYIENLLEG